jgi:hypothetical protein
MLTGLGERDPGHQVLEPLCQNVALPDQKKHDVFGHRLCQFNGIGKTFVHVLALIGDEQKLSFNHEFLLSLWVYIAKRMPSDKYLFCNDII